MAWTATEFHHWHSNLEDRAKAQRALDALSNPQRKQYRELKTFLSFATASSLDIDPRTIQNRDVPEPDILCGVAGKPHYFELGELTDEGIPRAESAARKIGDDVYGGSCSWQDPLEKMIFEKCQNVYELNGLPASLVLHYAVGHQVPPVSVVNAYLRESRERIAAALKTSCFHAIHFFNGWTDTVFAVIEGTV